MCKGAAAPWKVPHRPRRGRICITAGLDLRVDVPLRCSRPQRGRTHRRICLFPAVRPRRGRASVGGGRNPQVKTCGYRSLTPLGSFTRCLPPEGPGVVPHVPEGPPLPAGEGPGERLPFGGAGGEASSTPRCTSPPAPRGSVARRAPSRCRQQTDSACLGR